ncbi:metal ABC transporter solute-binding protein, Zn/Mn family [Corallincola platygyrae]|uniref:Metal ABC transporter solute-binding protein, Zn/Mn family n=1 Tax=Corallincola platygyrae TaxID=1193278 RepID=A0ABW4XP39_9GAMM
MVRISTKTKAGLLAGLICVLSPQAMALNIFACEPEWAALAGELAPEAEIYSATTAYQDPHMVQARPSLIAKLRRADMFVCSGAELEIGWLPALQMKANNRDVRDNQPGAFYAALQVERLDVMQSVTRLMGDVHGMGNPHVHLDPRRMLVIAEALAKRMSEIDPALAEHYQQNLKAFAARWRQSTSDWEAMTKPLQGKQVVAYHTSYRYLFDWLSIEQVADLEPKPGLPPTSSHLAGLLNQIKGQPILGVVYSNYQDPKAAEWLSEKTGFPVIPLAYTVGADGTEDLFALYQRIIEQLLHAVESA